MSSIAAEWISIDKEQPPTGVPLLVTVKADWKGYPEVLGPVYRLQNHANGNLEFLNYGPDAGFCAGGLIGPTDCNVIAWAKWPEPYGED